MWKRPELRGDFYRDLCVVYIERIRVSPSASLRNPHPLQKLREARIRVERVQLRFQMHPDELWISFVVSVVQPIQRLILLVQGRQQKRYHERREVSMFTRLENFIKNRQRVIVAPVARVSIAQR